MFEKQRMTRAEWTLLALWSKLNGTMPNGNNSYGKDASEATYKAIPSMPRDTSNRIQRTATGSGPLSWSHNGAADGVFDLNGNVWEWLGGIRMVYGEVQVLVNNNAADSINSQSATSTLWLAISAVDGAYITPNGSGTTPNGIKLDVASNHWQWTGNTPTGLLDAGRGYSFESTTADSSVSADAKLKLQALGLLPYDTTAGAYLSDYFWANNGTAERLFLAGGTWNNAAGAGAFALNGNNARSNVNANVGFRSALPAKSEVADLLGLPTAQRAIKEYSPSTLALCACGEKLIAAYTATPSHF